MVGGEYRQVKAKLKGTLMRKKGCIKRPAFGVAMSPRKSIQSLFFSLNEKRAYNSERAILSKKLKKNLQR
jgi:hypothetical protein